MRIFDLLAGPKTVRADPRAECFRKPGHLPSKLDRAAGRGALADAIVADPRAVRSRWLHPTIHN